MMKGRVIALWLDGFDMDRADAWQLPNLARLAQQGAVATLHNGTAHYTGLTGEHLSTGLDPTDARRESGIHFDPQTYECIQDGVVHKPMIGGVPTVIFDVCYFDLDKTGNEVVGITDWGAHDPGGPCQSRPGTLAEEIHERFGVDPARAWIYVTPWASRAACTQMGRALSQAVGIRSRIAQWLLTERFTDWKLAVIGFSESHSASEGLFHGADATSPWARLRSAPQAGKALRSVYAAVDREVGEIVNAFPNDTVVLFSMHGMGLNNSDAPSMVLLGDLLARWCDIPHKPVRSFPLDRRGIPKLLSSQSWVSEILGAHSSGRVPSLRRVARSVRRRLPKRVQHLIARVRRQAVTGTRPVRPNLKPGQLSLDWMPIMRLRNQWSGMKAFAVPSFYDGRIRLNVQGREAHGVVNVDEYDAVIDEIETLIMACTESRTGKSVVRKIERRTGDPLQRANDDVDLIVYWADDVLGFSHPDLGVIGPVPPRRTGGHVSPIGRCVIVGPDTKPTSLGMWSSFDVMPTILGLAGVTVTTPISGNVKLPVG